MIHVFKLHMVRIIYIGAMLATIHLQPSLAQHHQDANQETASLSFTDIRPADSLKHLLHVYGKFEGHFRSYFLSTLNEGNSPDYYALALGGGLAYYSPVIRNFQIAISGFIIYNAMSSDLTYNNGFRSRYEMALFDVTDPENRKDLDRLENLYLRYYLNSRRRSFAQLGKFHLNTPLLNLQDSRMRPNLQEGLWLELKEWEKLKFQGGLLWGTSPRSTVDWFGIGESVGIYGSGRSLNGQPAEYLGHIQSKRIVIGSLEWAPHRNFNYELWDYHVDNLFNIVLQKAEVKKHFTHTMWLAAAQYIWQQSGSDGALPDVNQYISPDEQAHVLSGRLALSHKLKGYDWSLNYTRITSHGRFLFPREWGTETLYTYNNRERNEGAGDVHAVMLEHSRQLGNHQRFLLRGRAGIYELPVIDNARLNKYAMPSYYHLTLEGSYKFKGLLSGLEAQILYSFKGNLDSNLEAPAILLQNKTEMHHFGVKIDFYF